VQQKHIVTAHLVPGSTARSEFHMAEFSGSGFLEEPYSLTVCSPS
jgi:hypothetical protein